MARPVGLRTEIIFTLTLLLGAALLLGGVMMLQLTEKKLLQQRLEQLDALVLVIGQSLKGLPAGELDKATRLLDKLPGQVQCQGWQIISADLQPLAAGGQQLASPFSAAARRLVVVSAEIQRHIQYTPMLNFFDQSPSQTAFLLPLRFPNNQQAVLEIHFSLDGIRTELLQAGRMVVLYVLLYGAVLGLAGYYLLLKNVIRPARGLLQATQAVARGDLETRLPTAGPTEFSQLADAYNQMVEALRSSHAETQEQIHNLEETNRQLQQARDELIRSEKLASVGQLAAGLAHELGNPLAALIGYLEFLKQRLADATDRDIIERSLVESQRIDFLVRELLDFSRPDDANVSESTDPVDELRAAVQLLANQGNLAQTQVIDHLPTQADQIRINRQKLQQVFINLLLNAIQACTVSGQITLTTGQEHDQLWIVIADNGCGMNAEQKKRIFEPFFTTKEPGQGTGLGLAICQRIIEEAGGRIQVESKPGEGSYFRLMFKADCA